MSKLPRAFGSAVRTLRVAQRVSQERLAMKARVSRTYAGELERGEKSATLEVADRIARALGLPLWVMLREIDADPHSKR